MCWENSIKWLELIHDKMEGQREKGDPHKEDRGKVDGAGPILVRQSCTHGSLH